jgi:hypothetical protein
MMQVYTAKLGFANLKGFNLPYIKTKKARNIIPSLSFL